MPKCACFLALEPFPINNTLPEIPSIENEHITFHDTPKLSFRGQWEDTWLIKDMRHLTVIRTRVGVLSDVFKY